MNPRDWLTALRSWPLLLAAVIAFFFGVFLTQDDTQRLYAAVALLTIGSVLLGAWIVLLVYRHHPPDDPPTDPPADPDA